jgi:hypothetical protein
VGLELFIDVLEKAQEADKNKYPGFESWKVLKSMAHDGSKKRSSNQDED